MMPKHTVLFSSRAPIGYVAIAENDVCTNQGFKSVVPNENTDYMFLYYLLLNNRQNIEHMGSGTTFKEVSGKTMRSIKVRVPESKEEQIRISSMLSVIDDKIEENERINKNLYAQAEAMYNSLLMTRETAPADWSETTLGQVTQNIRTRVGNNTYRVLSAVNTGELRPSDEYFTKQVFSKNISNYIVVNENDFAYNPARVNIGSIGFNDLGYTGCVSPVYVVFRVSPQYEYFFRFFIKSDHFKEEVKMRASGSVRQALNYKDFSVINISYPEENALLQFNDFCKSIFSAIEQIQSESSKLVEIRDTLLPRLMSGELDVSDIDL